MPVISDHAIVYGSPDPIRSVSSEAREALSRLQSLSDEIEEIRSSLQPLSILLEACCNTSEMSENKGNLIAILEPRPRSDVEKRWIKIFADQDLIRIAPKGNINISPRGLKKLEKWI